MTNSNENRLNRLEQKQQQIKQQIDTIKQRQKQQQQKHDTRKKILIGAAVLKEIQLSPNFQEVINEILNRNVTKKIDRKLLELD